MNTYTVVSTDNVTGTQSPWTQTMTMTMAIQEQEQDQEDAKSASTSTSSTSITSNNNNAGPDTRTPEQDTWQRSTHTQRHGHANQRQVQVQTQTDVDEDQVVHPTMVADKYLLLELLDGSSLCRCVHLRSQQEYVCKVVGRDCSGLLAAHYRLDCQPHVNPLHEVLLGDKRVYLIFPRSYGDLHSHVKTRKRLREPEARRLFRQMAETVRSCHDQGIVLRDLKLRKFVFSDVQRTELKLESLEDAVVLDHSDDDLLQDKRGCPAYVSPEILRAHRTYSGKAADMWSLGVILYTMLVGRYPFNDSEHASLFAKISRGFFVVPECLSSRAKCLIRSLLRREPSERLGASEVLLHPWLADGDRPEPSAKSTDQCVPDVQIPDDDYL